MSLMGFGTIDINGRQGAIDKWRRLHRWHRLWATIITVITISLLIAFIYFIGLSYSSPATLFRGTIGVNDAIQLFNGLLLVFSLLVYLEFRYLDRIVKIKKRVNLKDLSKHGYFKKKLE